MWINSPPPHPIKQYKKSDSETKLQFSQKYWAAQLSSTNVLRFEHLPLKPLIGQPVVIICLCVCAFHMSWAVTDRHISSQMNIKAGVSVV